MADSNEQTSKKSLLKPSTPTLASLAVSSSSAFSNSSAAFSSFYSAQSSRETDGDEDEGANEKKRILILYTGGTIGMTMTESGYAPKANFLANTLSKMHMFQDFSRPDERVMPPSKLAGDVFYDIIEYEPLLDSSNMGERDWIKIARDVERHYNDYDGFVILHGTDTMAYTASALSFMLENLGKTVILTGSQIPLIELRNDAIDNLLGALLLAGHFVIPEVCLFFSNKLLRGNRARKSDASGLKAFSSPNYRPLATVGVDINVNWTLVRPPPDEPFRVSTSLCDAVGTLRLFPGIPTQIIRNFMQPPLRGLVLETYGAGNGPDCRPLFLEALREGTEKNGVVIVNITQCGRGRVVDRYACGMALRRVGVVGGEDMTSEAALTKLMYLLGRQDLTLEQVRHLVKVDLRGELTPSDPHPVFSFQNKKFIHAVAVALGEGVSGTRDLGGTPHRDLVINGIAAALNPVLLCFTAATADIAALRQLIASGADPNSTDYDGRTPLHLACTAGHQNVVEFLLRRSADVNITDHSGNTPLDCAQRAGHAKLVELLTARGARSSTSETSPACPCPHERSITAGWETTHTDVPTQTPSRLS